MVNFLETLFDASIPGQRINAAREQRAQREASAAQRERDAKAFQAIQSGDVLGAAQLNPELAGQFHDVQQQEKTFSDEQTKAQQEALRAAVTRASRAGKAAIANGGDPVQVFDDLVARSGSAFGSPEDVAQVRPIIEQFGAQGFDIIEQALKDPPKAGQRPSSVREFEFFDQLSPEDQARFLEVQRSQALGVKDIGGVPTAVFQAPGGSVRGTQLSSLPEEIVAGQALKQGEARGAALGKVEGEIAGEDAPKSQAAGRKAAANVAGGEQRLQLVEDTIDTAIEQAGIFTTGLLGGSALIPGTPAANLAANLRTIESNVGFAELQRLRDMSPTGGALGQVSEKENVLLQSVLGALAQSQGPEQFKTNLRKVKTQLRQSWERVADAYEDDFGVPYQGFGSAPGLSPEKQRRLEELRAKRDAGTLQ